MTPVEDVAVEVSAPVETDDDESGNENRPAVSQPLEPQNEIQNEIQNETQETDEASAEKNDGKDSAVVETNGSINESQPAVADSADAEYTADAEQSESPSASEDADVVTTKRNEPQQTDSERKLSESVTTVTTATTHQIDEVFATQTEFGPDQDQSYKVAAVAVGLAAVGFTGGFDRRREDKAK